MLVGKVRKYEERCVSVFQCGQGGVGSGDACPGLSLALSAGYYLHVILLVAIVHIKVWE